jgi:hypothetical protein
MGKTMKKVIIFLTVCISSYRCNNYVQPTPKKYKYAALAKSKDQYRNDSIVLIHSLDTLLSKHIDPFSPPSAYNTKFTTIYIDSILYSPDKNGIVIFIITKRNKNKVENIRNSKDEYFFDARYLYAKRDRVNNGFKLYNYSSIAFVNFTSFKEAENVLFEYCFGRRATDHNFSKDEPFYNMDDIRFWDGNQFRNIYNDTSFIKW